ncbi:MAG: Nif3-like dinuclear metal center hexameric protein [Chlamydiales bacterium]
MQTSEFVEKLNSYLDIASFVDFCPNGLQVEGKKEVRRAATAVSANLQTIEQAVALKVDALLVHHGLFWTKDPYLITGTKRKKLALLLENNISLLAYHLPLDGHREIGNNWHAAERLGWKELEPFEQIGVKGTFSPLPIDQFVEILEDFYEHKATVALGGKKEVSSAALISGGAYRTLLDAVREGIDCFITGNFDEPAWSWAMEENMHFLAMGHSASERIGPRALAQYVERSCQIDCSFLDVANPF